MIERIYIKEYLNFDEVEIEPTKGLNVFTGRSGAGKSILMKGILAIFGIFDSNAKLSEAIVNNKIDLDKYGIESDEILVFRQIKKNKNRYFVNNQAVSKKHIREISRNFINYLSLKEIEELQSNNILEVLDKMIKEKEYYVNFLNFKKKYKKIKQIKEKLEKIKAEEKKAKEKIEFLEFEINKIKSINPKIGEFEELIELKKDMSKIEKLKEKAREIENLFSFENKVYEFLNLIEENAEFFSNTMNELRIILDKVNEKMEKLENVNVEEILDRLSKLQELINRYGSIEETLKYLERKQKELEFLKNISFEKANLEEELKSTEKELFEIGEYLHKKRLKVSNKLIEKLNYFLQKLHMPTATIKILKTTPNELGLDKVEIIIDNINIDKISTGELNRLRVAFLAAKLEYFNEEKTLFLDEIDANLSGEESMSVAEVLKYLSSKYQIFVISHQPQLSSIADKHFLIEKENNKSFVRELNLNERINEIARIIGGKEKSKKALEFAKELLKANND